MLCLLSAGCLENTALSLQAHLLWHAPFSLKNTQSKVALFPAEICLFTMSLEGRKGWWVDQHKTADKIKTSLVV